MKIFAFDPSSTVTGAACMDYKQQTQHKLLSHAILRPKARQRANDRIDTICKLAIQFVQSNLDGTDYQIVIEDTSGHVNKKRHRGGGAGLATYGKSIYALKLALQHAYPHIPVLLVKENEWIGSRSKEARKVFAKVVSLGEYQRGKDKGGDAADAICLAWWQCATLRVQAFEAAIMNRSNHGKLADTGRATNRANASAGNDRRTRKT